MSTVTTPRPVFSALDETAARAVLSRNHVGRLCFLDRGMVDIEPVHYVLSEQWIFVRSANGTKLEALAHTPYAAFEVDEIDDTFDWRSVVIRGTIYLMRSDGAPFERREFSNAVHALRSFVPRTLRRGDPTPFRQTVFGIHIDTLTGRMAEPGHGPAKRQTSRVARALLFPRTPDGF